jgi:hypothetical protein
MTNRRDLVTIKISENIHHDLKQFANETINIGNKIEMFAGKLSLEANYNGDNSSCVIRYEDEVLCEFIHPHTHLDLKDKNLNAEYLNTIKKEFIKKGTIARRSSSNINLRNVDFDEYTAICDSTFTVNNNSNILELEITGITIYYGIYSLNYKDGILSFGSNEFGSNINISINENIKNTELPHFDKSDDISVRTDKLVAYLQSVIA